MDQLDLGQATIVYEDPDDGLVEETVDNEDVVYARDHWMVRSGTDDQNNDLMTQIPRDRVHRVDRNVEQFEQEAQTVRRRAESVARDIRERLPVDFGGRSQDSPPTDHATAEGENIPVESGNGRHSTTERPESVDDGDATATRETTDGGEDGSGDDANSTDHHTDGPSQPN